MDDQTRKELEYQEHLKDRTSLIEAEREGAKAFDKAVLTLASGAFGLSLVVLKDIAPQPLPETLCFLRWSWGFLVAAIATVLASFLVSQEACRRQIVISYIESVQKRKAAKNHWATATWILGLVAFALLILGTALLAAFAYYNL